MKNQNNRGKRYSSSQNKKSARNMPQANSTNKSNSSPPYKRNKLHSFLIIIIILLIIALLAYVVYSFNSKSTNPENSQESSSVDSSAASEIQSSIASRSSASSNTEESPTPSPTPSPAPSPTPSPTPSPVATLQMDDSSFLALNIEEKFDILAEYFPDGSYWNHSGVDILNMSDMEAAMVTTNTSCDHDYEGYIYCNIYNGMTLYEFTYDYNTQCLGFASLISDFLFGSGSDTQVFYDSSELAPGDHIRYTSAEHSMIVLEVYDDYVTVLECNADYLDCKIEWGRVVTMDELSNNYHEYIRRV